MDLSIAGRSQPVDLLRATDLVLDFCLFDRSYENYDLSETAEFDAQEAVDLAYRVGGRSPVKKQVLVQNLTRMAPNISKLLADVSKYSLDEVDDSNWEMMRPKVEELLSYSTDGSPSKVKGMSRSFLTKALHPYARRFLPILDQLAVPAPYGPGRAAAEYVDMVRRDMRNSRELLTNLQEHLRDRGVHLSRVRIFDILLWTLWRQRQPELDIPTSAVFGAV
jgi:hypothetical protein